MSRILRRLAAGLTLLAALCAAGTAQAADCRGTGTLGVTLSPCPLVKQLKYATPIFVSTVATLSGSFPSQIYVGANAPSGIFQSSSFSPRFISSNRLMIGFETEATLLAGRHTGRVDIRICADRACKKLLSDVQLLYDFTVFIPPVVSNLEPSSVVVGSARFTLKVHGSRFTKGSTIHLGSSVLTTKFVSSFELTASVDPHTVHKAGQDRVTVVPAAGFSSNAVTFTFKNPEPIITAVTPDSALVASSSYATYSITVTGKHFMVGSRINFGGSPQTTTFVSSTQLTANVTIQDAATGAAYNVKVVNPTPGGGPSAPATFTLYNSAPVITSLTPSSIPIVGYGLGVTIHGTGLQYNSKVQIDGVTYPVCCANGTLSQVEVTVPPNTFSTGANLPLVVTNPTPGGGTSNTVTLEVDNPAPELQWISPVQAYAGSGDMVLTVRASKLNSTSLLEWNGVPLQGVTSTPANEAGIPTQFLQVTAPAADLTTAGMATVSVVTPGPGGGTASATFAIVQHPPEIGSLAPGFIAPGSGDFTLTLYGVDFDPDAMVYWNGDALATTYVSATELQAVVPAADVSDPGVAKLTVANPDATGGTSLPASFAVDAGGTSVQALAQPVNDLEWDPWRFMLYGTTHGDDPNYPHAILSMDPVAASIMSSAGTSFVAEGHQMSLSKDGKVIYVAVDIWGIERFALPGFTYSGDLYIGGSNATVGALQVSPLYSHVLAMTIRNTGLASSNHGGSVFDNSDVVGYWSPNETWDAMAWSADGLSLYAGDTEDTPKSFMSGTYSLANVGTQSFQSTGNLWSGGPMHVDATSGLVYADNSSNVIDPVSATVVGAFPVSGVMVPDSSLGCAYFITQTQAQIDAAAGDWTLSCYNTADQTLTRSMVIAGVMGTPTKMLRWGNEGLAFMTDGGYIYFVSGQIVTGN